ncbi:pitrilysin family protein [Lentimicrobium sp. S6]|uniref:M16 family metallopeptidase n=1 Tax=Lentimicrobium sp. S6 TaxID=2735872 RepID=UPI001556484E|nr:M16 family metallopeptidase [Lentimicrobium sp. S6]NPD45079.1 insulinase family protein [Lentimicrobium sp. S6]
MKKFIFTFWVALLFLGFTQSTVAQDLSAQLTEEIPFDSQVLTGKLGNGITYYIRPNAKPENKVELRLVVNAGSILEDDDQQGLAHFCEHMCFNGTEHFEKNELVSYLQSLGIEFGGDLNAYTSFDETVYMLPVPTEDPETVDKGLLVLADWANGVSFTDEEIDKERGVILEELRIGQGAQQRMRDEYFPIMFKNSMYAERLPIGLKDILETFEYETIRRFYREWYRPDLMAVIAIGDLEPQEMLRKIEDKFGSIEMPKEYRERKEFEVPDHKETYISVVSDKEAPYTMIQLMYKDDTQETKLWNDYRRDLTQSMYNGMLGARLGELTQSATPPFMFASTSYGGMVRSKNSYSSFAVVGPDGIEHGLKTLLEENQRVKLHGFTQSELDRYKTEYITRLEKAFKEADKTESARYVNEYVNHFLEEVPSPGIEAEYGMTQKLLPTIKLEEVNALAAEWIKDYNRVVVIMAPEQEGLVLPTENEVSTWLSDADKNKVEAYVDAVSDRPLMEVIPEAAAITKTETIAEDGIEILEFANGLKVVLKPTEFKNDEILVSAYSLGGSSLYNDEEFKSAEMGSQLVSESGVNGFSNIELEKLLAGKNIRINPYISSLKEGFSGNATPKDFETMLQLINLYFTAPNFDEEAFASIISKSAMYLPNLLQDPTTYYRDQVSHVVADNHIRGNYIPSVEELKSYDFEIAKKAYQERFANAGDFVFFFVGNINKDTDIELIQKYLGSLKGEGTKESFVDHKVNAPKGPIEVEVKKGQDEKSMVTIYFTAACKYDAKEKYLLTALGDVLSIKLIENLREEKSGVYGVGARGSMSQFPSGKYRFSIGFPCGPENVDELIAAAISEVENLKKDGPTQEDIDKVKETQRLDFKENLEKNRFWLKSMEAAYFNNGNMEDITKKQEMIENLNAKELKKIAKKYLKEDTRIEVVLLPEDK